ncbi:hypothetical protein Brsp07_04662 [Brucella sp. NBRC 14130]|uniref:hypothetical protein n=1 Tax=Brucella sp. NBRC 14130 TaxID=3075483 RepID=UPI0030A566BB
MAVLSDYTSGTISLANGSATVTGTGTLFEVTRFREGDTLQIQNLTAVIASVDSDTQLTLTEPWTGTSIVDGPYRARQLADGTRVGTQAATLIELLGDGTLAGIAALGVEEGKSLVGGPAGQYELVDTSTFGIQDPNGSLGKLAALTLAANKILNTDGSGNLTQSDITAAALVLLKLAGTAAANKLPYFDAANSAALADISQQARTMLASTTPAVTSLGYTPLNKAGDTVQASLGVTDDLYMGKSIVLPPPTGQVYALSSTSAITIAQGSPFIAYNFSGLMIVTNINQGGTVGIVCGGGSVTTAFQVGTHNAGNFTWAQNENGYAFFNQGGAANFSVILIRTRNGA